jgi:hypothetical protein
MAAGLDRHHPFNNRPTAELLARNAESILADQLSSRHANTAWALFCNFIVLDRLCTAFAAAAVPRCQPIPRTQCDKAAIGTAAQVSVSLIIFTLLSHLNISSYKSSPRPPK